MFRFLRNRLAFIIIVCIIIIFLAFLGTYILAQSDNTETGENVSFLRNFTNSLEATGDYLLSWAKRIFKFNIATSITLPPKDKIRYSYRNSMGLLLISLAASSILGILFGMIAAVIRNKVVAGIIMGLTIIGISAPSFVAGLLLQQSVFTLTRTLHHTYFSVAGLGWDYKHLTLPVLVLSARPIAYIARNIKAHLEYVVKEGYMVTAKAKGLSRPWTISVHGMMNMIVPVITTLGVSLRFSLSSLPVVEYFFAWPGMGLGLLTAINDREAVTVATDALIIGITFLVINLLMDMSFRIIDPRMRGHNGGY